MKNYHYKTPILRGLTSICTVINEEQSIQGEIQRVYKNHFSKLVEAIITGWNVTVKIVENSEEIWLKDRNKWIGMEWEIIKNGSSIGLLKNVRKIELGDTKELFINNELYLIENHFLDKKTNVYNENREVIATIHASLIDLTNKRKLELYSEELSPCLIAAIGFVTEQKYRG